MRAIHSSMPFKMLLKLVVRHLYMFTLLWMNAFPVVYAILRIFSSR